MERGAVDWDLNGARVGFIGRDADFFPKRGSQRLLVGAIPRRDQSDRQSRGPSSSVHPPPITLGSPTTALAADFFSINPEERLFIQNLGGGRGSYLIIILQVRAVVILRHVVNR